MTFTWFPGHMRKALRRIEEDARNVDVVLLALDARIPTSSRNETLERLLVYRKKLLVFVLTRADLAEPAVTTRWLQAFEGAGQAAVALAQGGGDGRSRLLKTLRQRHDKLLAAAPTQSRTLRCLVVGIPNVGKSTLINRLAGSARARAGKRPGLTRGPQWVSLDGGIELMDTPGVMLPGKLEPSSLLALAVTGAIKEEVLPLDDLGPQLAALVRSRGWEEQAIGQALPAEISDHEWLAEFSKRRGFLLRGGEPDLRRSTLHLLKTVREGRWGPMTLEVPPDDVRVPHVGPA